MPLVGVISPSNRPGSSEQLRMLLPAEVELVEANLDITYGADAELSRAVDEYERKIEEMAAAGADLIHSAGAPPLLLGYEGEREQVRRWEARCGRPVFTNGISQVAALRAFGARRVVGATYLRGAIVARSVEYLTQAGFEVLGIASMDVAFHAVPQLLSDEIYAFIKAAVVAAPEADALYILGPAWRRSLDLLETLEREFGIPAVHHVPAQSWEIGRRLGLRAPRTGYGRLMNELP